MHLFLKGPRGIGKSTLLRGALLPHQARLAGFVVQRLKREGRTAGFRAVPLDGVLPPLETELEEGMDGVFLLDGRKDVSVLDRIVAQAETDCRNPGCKLVLLDEIGGIELASKEFQESLRRILSGAKPCIGVLKSRENLEHASSMLGLGDDCLDLWAELECRIARNGRILEFDGENEKACRAALDAVIESGLRGGQPG